MTMLVNNCNKKSQHVNSLSTDSSEHKQLHARHL
jgi:hypothetical protein